MLKIGELDCKTDNCCRQKPLKRKDTYNKAHDTKADTSWAFIEIKHFPRIECLEKREITHKLLSLYFSGGTFQ